MSLARKPIYRLRRVLTAPYYVNRFGCLRPERPSQCPEATGDAPCVIVWHGFACRKCGPRHPIVRCRCRTHRTSFRVYPHGFGPFGRRPVVGVTPAGFDVERDAAGLEAWGDTAFGAAVDAAAGRAWPQAAAGVAAYRKAYDREPYGVQRTQWRHLAGVNALFALGTELESARPTVVAALGAGLSHIVESATRARDGPSLAVEGAKGADILSALGPPRRHMLAGMTRLGVDRGYWGPPMPQ